MKSRLWGTALTLLSMPATAFADNTERVRDTGASGLWILANISYAGMRAQDSPSQGWRIVAFIFGFPGTLLSFFVVPEGGERAYGVDVPRRRSEVLRSGPGDEP
jgi:uncharacterized membrane protein YhaH (DUF805 family)